MRRTFLLFLAVALAAAAIVAATWRLRKGTSAREQQPADVAVSLPLADERPRSQTWPKDRVQTSGLEALPTDIETRVAKLEALAWEHDAESLQQITAHLADPEPAIRQAALAATRAFGSQEAIPALKSAAARLSDPEELNAIQETIEYLALPTVIDAEDAEDPQEE